MGAAFSQEPTTNGITQRRRSSKDYVDASGQTVYTAPPPAPPPPAPGLGQGGKTDQQMLDERAKYGDPATITDSKTDSRDAIAKAAQAAADAKAQAMPSLMDDALKARRRAERRRLMAGGLRGTFLSGAAGPAAATGPSASLLGS